MLAASAAPANAAEPPRPAGLCLAIGAIDTTAIERARWLGPEFAVQSRALLTAEIARLPQTQAIAKQPLTLDISVTRMETSGYVGWTKRASGELRITLARAKETKPLESWTVSCAAQAPTRFRLGNFPDQRIRAAATLCLTDAAAQIRQHMEESLGADCKWRAPIAN